MKVPKTVAVLLLVASALAGKTQLSVINMGQVHWKNPGLSVSVTYGKHLHMWMACSCFV